MSERARTRELWTLLRYINLRHLRDHRRRVLLTVAGLGVSVCMLVAIGVINATLSRSIQSETRGLAGAAALQVIPGGAAPLPASMVAAATGTPGVQAAVPVLRVVTRIKHDHLSEPLLLFAVPHNLPSLFPRGLGDAGRQLATPRFASGALILTRQLAAPLGVRVNDLVAVQTPDGTRRLRVGAVVAHNPLASLNGGVFALMALSPAQRLFGRGGEVSSIYVTARAGVQRSALRALLHHRLGNGVSVGAPGAEGQAYEQTFSALAAVTEKTRSIGLLVALLLVINTMAMAVAERREEIARLVVVGAQRRQIFGAFLAEAGILGLIGGVIGVTGGVLLAHALVQRAVASYNVLPVTVSGPLALESGPLLTGLAAGFCTCVVGAAVPARRILKVAPIDALRPEGNYEWGVQRRRPIVARLAAFGVLAITLGAVVMWRLPIGSDPALFTVALLLGLVGAVLVMPLLMPLLARLLQLALRPLLGPCETLGADALLRSPGRTALTAGGIAIAVGFVIAVSSGIGSFRAAVGEAAAQWYRAPLDVNLEGATSYVVNQPVAASVSRQLGAVKGVKALYPMRYGLINAYGHQTLIEAMPIAQAAAGGTDIMGSLGISRRALIRALGRGEIVISRLTAHRYHLVPGDVFPLPSTRGPIAIRIGGLFDDLASFDSVLIEHSVYERLSGDRQADGFVVVTQPGANITAVKHGLQRLLDEQGIAASVLTSGQMASYLTRSVSGLFAVAQGIEDAALLMAALIVLSTMATATFERSRELGVERTLGMSCRQLSRAVIFEGAAMTAVGAIVGVALGLGLGLLLTLSLQNQLGWPVSFHPSATHTLEVVIIATVIGALAALYPARLATRRTITSLLQDDRALQRAGPRHAARAVTAAAPASVAPRRARAHAGRDR